MPAKPSTIDEYLAGVSEDKRAALEKVRKAIKTAAPKAEECISYGLAAFRLDGRILVCIGAGANHCSFYPGAHPLAVFSKAADLPEGLTRLPVKTIHINKSPVVIANLKTLSPEMAQRWGLDMAAGLAHADWARANTRALEALPWRQVFQRPDAGAAPDVDQDLYGGFINPADRRLLDKLRSLGADKLAAQRPVFADARLEELVFRYRARNFPATLTGDDLARWQQHCSERLHDGAGGITPVADFLERIDSLSETADERGQAILGALVDYAEQIAPELD